MVKRAKSRKAVSYTWATFRETTSEIKKSVWWGMLNSPGFGKSILQCRIVVDSYCVPTN